MTIAVRSPVEAFVGRLRATPCCAAIVEPWQLGEALASPVPIVFILRGNGLELAPVIDRVHAAGKLVAAHLDLVDGLRPDRRGVGWLSRAGADAIITSHGALVGDIRGEGVVAIQRLLLSRRSNVDAAVSAIARSAPDIVEVLPGAILPAVTGLVSRFDAPVLAGGFVRTVAVARAVLAAGAIGITTSSIDLWTCPWPES